MKEDLSNNTKGFRFPFVVKLGLAISILAVLSTGGSAYYIFRETRHLVLEDLRNRLKDIGRAGAYLFDEQHRAELSFLAEQVNLHTRFKESPEQKNILYGDDGKALTDDDGTYESLAPALSSQIMAGPQFQRIVQTLRKIREGTRQKIRPLQSIPALHTIRKQSEDIPTLEYIYMLLPVKGYPSEKYVLYLADSDYLPVEDDGTGEAYEGNPIGNITLTLTPEMSMGFVGQAVAEQDFTVDQWGDVVISGYVPILDKDREVIAVLGMDYNVKSEANQIAALGQISLTIVVATFFLAVSLAVFISRRLNRPIAILQEGAQRVAKQDFNARVSVHSKDELGDLARAFNIMVSEIGHYAKDLQELNAAFERFVPYEFLQHMGQTNIVDVRLGDQAEREMTVLFSDIRSFTSISETMSPKENFNFLNNYLGHVSPLIRSHHGFIDKFIGDAIMALFPRKPSDAIQNAIDMLLRLKMFNQEQRAVDKPAITIGVGLHTGRLMLGTIGEEQRMESTVISDAVNVASRLQGFTKRFGVNILISEEAAQKASSESFMYRPLGRVRIKGKVDALKIVEIYNADSNEQIELKNKTQNLFAEGLDFFQKAKRKQAQSNFTEILRINPDDTVVRVYYDYCVKN